MPKRIYIIFIIFFLASHFTLLIFIIVITVWNLINKCKKYSSRSSTGWAELWRCLGYKFESYLEQISTLDPFFIKKQEYLTSKTMMAYTRVKRRGGGSEKKKGTLFIYSYYLDTE